MSNESSLSVEARLALSEALFKLPDPQFKQLVFALKLPAGILPSDQAALGDRVVVLLQWVENNGPGLALLQQVLEQISQPSNTQRLESDSAAFLTSLPANFLFSSGQILLKNDQYTIQNNESEQIFSSSPSEWRLNGKPVSLALKALGDLISTQEARLAVADFQKNFQKTCEQINIIANYKALHDCLHRLEFCFRNIEYNTKRFAGDETVLGDFIYYEQDIEDILVKVQDIVDREVITNSEVRWLKDIKKAQEEFHEGIEKNEAKQLHLAIESLSRVLAVQPSRINTSLKAAAKELQLSALIDAMKMIWKKLVIDNLDQDKLSQFHQGIEMLSKMEQRLAILIKQHNNWQGFDLELQRVEKDLDRYLTESEMAWLNKELEELIDDINDSWSIEFQKTIYNLNEALKVKDNSKVRQYFIGYRSRASRKFHQVDTDLKVLCEELQKIGEPLAFVLRIFE
jgi:hypothetical protein